MGKPFRIDDDRLVRALEEGTDIVIVGRRRFRLVEVESDSQGEDEFYEPTDHDEIRALEEALHDDSELMVSSFSGSVSIQAVRWPPLT